MNKGYEKIHPTESRAVADLIPYSGNAKIHDPSQIHKLATAIRTSGFDVPIVVDGEGVIIKGHGRRLAAIELGMKFVPVIVRDDLPPEKVKAARLADNRVAEGDNDLDALHKELAELAEIGFDLDGLGFDGRELDFLTDNSLDDMNMDALIDDLDSAVAEHEENVSSKATESKERMLPLKEAFGFAGLSVDQARLVNKFMARLEDETCKKGADALTIFVGEFLA